MMTRQSRAFAAPGKQSAAIERSTVLGIARDRRPCAPLSVPSELGLQICVEEQTRAHSVELATLDSTLCPSCSDPFAELLLSLGFDVVSATLVQFTADQLPLLRGCGYGEAQRNVRRQCRVCGWSLLVERGAVKP